MAEIITFVTDRRTAPIIYQSLSSSLLPRNLILGGERRSSQDWTSLSSEGGVQVSHNHDFYDDYDDHGDVEGDGDNSGGSVQLERPVFWVPLQEWRAVPAKFHIFPGRTGSQNLYMEREKSLHSY